jgi:UDP-N-acetylglucosamine diphosphorylase / glucose-1-phosphate thymidylyltransferase / UDP-N-acetylgalactosamine diphosphorylase / glucosamine-1-phosphate N-acetyltransferase / galactosamine-1-phosphate N-acetyltransferase
MKQAIILAAGEGRRLKPFAATKPKAMISIVHKPVIQYVIEALAANNVCDIILVAGYQREQIYDFVGDGRRFGVSVRYVVQDKQLGTAHALTTAKDLVSEEFMVLSGNKLIMPDTIGDLLGKPAPAVLITRVDNPSRYGVVSFKSGKILKIVEKPVYPESNYISTGIYTLRKEAFVYFEGERNIPDALNNMLLEGENIEVVETSGTWLDIVYPWDILSLNSLILEKLESGQNGTIEPAVHLRGRVSIGKDTNIRSNTYIVGPVAIGNGCEIGPNVCIFASTSIGDNVTIAPFSDIKNSVIQDDVEIGSHSSIEDSVIDQGCVIGSHLSAHSEEAEIKIDDEYHKLSAGTMIGKSCRIGNTVNLLPGSIIGNYCRISSLKLISGEIPERSLVV